MTVEELDAVRGYVSNIQAIKDAHNTEQLPINYGTICAITANGWKLIEELKALEQETCERCEDCIRRSDVGLTDFEIVMCNGDYKEGLKMLLNKIEKAPSVTPQPKIKTEKCKWIRYDYRTICPQNHDIGNPYWRIPENTECLKYCPYCGKEVEVTE